MCMYWGGGRGGTCTMCICVCIIFSNSNSLYRKKRYYNHSWIYPSKNYLVNQTRMHASAEAAKDSPPPPPLSTEKEPSELPPSIPQLLTWLPRTHQQRKSFLSSPLHHLLTWLPRTHQRLQRSCSLYQIQN